MDMAVNDASIGHACGVFGVYAPGQAVAHLTYLGLYALQHRGQESAGIAVSDGETITVVEGHGPRHPGLRRAPPRAARGSPRDRPRPLLAPPGRARGATRSRCTGRSATPASRSGTTATSRTRSSSPSASACCPGVPRPTTEFDSTTDSALVAELIARAWPTSPAPTAATSSARSSRCCRGSQGGFSLVLMDEAHLIGVRDPHGFWPLVLGRIEGGWVLASETAALDIVGAHFVRDVEPGEMVVIDASGRARRSALRRSRPRSSASSSSSTSPAPTRSSTARACTRRASAWARSSRARRRSTPTW